MSPPADIPCRRRRSPGPCAVVSPGGGWRRLTESIRPIFFAAILTFGGGVASDAAGQTGKESDLQSVLLYDFMAFVEWPPDSFPAADTPFLIGILGHDPFGRVLDDLVRRETYHRRPIAVERYRSAKAIGPCQILFVDASQMGELPRILAAVRDQPILTVGNSENFAARGGMICLQKNSQNKIALQINLTAAKASRLVISARLLRVAEVVSPLLPESSR